MFAFVVFYLVFQY